MLLCGGIDFRLSDLGDVASSCENDQQAYQILAAKNIGLPYLDGSEQEVDSIALLRHVGTDSIALLRHVGTDCLLRGSEATESAVRQLMEHYNVLHFSTHGYCAEASNAGSDIRPMDSDTQLSQSCLFLAGAEHNLHTAAFDTSQPDGILSARELAGHDLSGVDLAVLSACQSGVGALTIDGIFGLQRGLKTAGVGAIVASLWSVDDQATVTLMQELHRNLQTGMPLHDAFQQARQTLRTVESLRIRRRPGLRPFVYPIVYDQPRYYDAFILIDGLE